MSLVVQQLRLDCSQFRSPGLIPGQGTSLVAQTVKNPPAMQETQVQSLGQEDPLEKGMITHSTCLENPVDRGVWQATVRGVAKESDMIEQRTLS